MPKRRFNTEQIVTPAAPRQSAPKRRQIGRIDRPQKASRICVLYGRISYRLTVSMVSLRPRNIIAPMTAIGAIIPRGADCPKLTF